MPPPNRSPNRPNATPRDLVLGAIAFVVFLWLGREVGGWLDLRPGPAPSIEAVASPTPGERTPVPLPSPTPPVEAIALESRLVLPGAS